jgi:hypothetical protein
MESRPTSALVKQASLARWSPARPLARRPPARPGFAGCLRQVQAGRAAPATDLTRESEMRRFLSRQLT